MAKVKLLHERTFGGKPLKSLKLYDDPFGDNEICVELAFVDGQIEFVSIGPGKPGILSSGLCYEVDSEDTVQKPTLGHQDTDPSAQALYRNTEERPSMAGATGVSAIVRDLTLIKVGADHEGRSRVLELASVFRARVVDVAPESLAIEITGTEDKINGLLELLRPFGLLEVVRTGQVSMRRGTKSSSAIGKGNGAGQIADDDNVSYSV